MTNACTITVLRWLTRCCAIAGTGILLLAGAGCFASGTVVSDPEPIDIPAASTPPQPQTAVWRNTLDAGLKDAQHRERPLLVIYAAHACEPCKALQKQLELPEVREKLGYWALVQLDVDHLEPSQTPYLAKLPVMRILTPQGKIVASREGYLSGKDLIGWLEDHAPREGQVNPDLATDDAPDAAATARLLAMLGGSDADVREAAIRRLAPWPQLVAKPAIAAFAKGNLRTRLAVLDLLQEWKAPVRGIDPWQPQTIDADRLDALGKWAAALKGSPTQPASADTERIAAAQIDLAALLQTADPGDAVVISSRLARLGPALLPEVLRRLKDGASDRDRARLTALRYRLVATESLSLAWPGGIDRLASTDPVTRHAAAEELSKRTTPGDGPLLLQLFSDPDPLVREISLRGLLQVGGNQGASMLVKLLHDPAPNVRAAVLKQLAEKPDPQVTPAIVEYIAQEKDADLIVHAVRVLRTSKSTPAIKCLIGLLRHESWHVRAEAIDALADVGDDASVSRDELAGALANRLDDPDSFVAARAMAALTPMVDSVSVDVLMRAVERRPELAMEVVNLLTGAQKMNVAATPALRAFCSNPLPAVRAAAVVGLAELAPRNCSDEIHAALHDKADDVRAAGATALFAVLNHELPRNGIIDRPSFLGFGGGPHQVDPVEWLEDFRSGKARAGWYNACLADLLAMLKSNQEPVRRAAAYPLVALGHEDQALPIVQAAARADPSSRNAACRILPWLPWNKRFAWTKTLLSIELTDAMTINLATQMSVIPDRRAADAAWFLLDGNNGGGAIEQVYGSLRWVYYVAKDGQPDKPQQADVDALKYAARNYAQKGSDNQRLVALSLLYWPARADSAEQAKKICEDPGAGQGLRMAAFQIMLRAQPPADAQRTASATLGASGAKSVQLLALRFLVLGRDSIPDLQAIHLFFPAAFDIYRLEEVNPGKPNDLKPPAGLTADVLLPYLKSDDEETAAVSGYLICLLGKKEGLTPLMNYWKTLAPNRDREETTMLVYRAIAALDDDAQTPVLEQIYHQCDKDAVQQLREFYQTICNMHGERALKLQKTIRDEVGIQRLQ